MAVRCLSSIVLALGASLAQPGSAAPSAFLGLRESTINQVLLDEIQGHFGGDVTPRLVAVEGKLRSLFQSLPKDRQDKLSPPAVRYALHRLFLTEHGWLVRGLEPNGLHWNASSPVLILRDRVPDYLYGLFEEHVTEHGFSLRELAVLAVALERLVRVETHTRMEAMYGILGFPTSSDLTESQVTRLFEANFMVYLFEENLTQAAAWIRKAGPHMQRIYPGWQDTQQWLLDTRLNFAYAGRHQWNPFRTAPLGFEQVMDVAEDINDRYGKFQDFECGQLKGILLQHEHMGSGRIRLSDFYGLALGGDMRFSETAAFLRQLGALDESDASDPSVIITNYIYGKSMCLAASSYYAVCCIDECNAVLAELERTFAAPAVEPSRLAVVLAGISSSTVAAPRNLSGVLLQRLDAIAAGHGGTVPLHGRLFAQLLHHAFPRECQFPHVSGTINPRLTRQWEVETGLGSTVTKEQVTQLGRNLTSAAPRDEFEAEQIETDWEVFAPWSEDEELLAASPPPPSDGGFFPLVRGAAMLAAAAALAGRLAQSLRAAHQGSCGEGKLHV